MEQLPPPRHFAAAASQASHLTEQQFIHAAQRLSCSKAQNQQQPPQLQSHQHQWHTARKDWQWRSRPSLPSPRLQPSQARRCQRRRSSETAAAIDSSAYERIKQQKQQQQQQKHNEEDHQITHHANTPLLYNVASPILIAAVPHAAAAAAAAAVITTADTSSSHAVAALANRPKPLQTSSAPPLQQGRDGQHKDAAAAEQRNNSGYLMALAPLVITSKWAGDTATTTNTAHVAQEQSTDHRQNEETEENADFSALEEEVNRAAAPPTDKIHVYTFHVAYSCTYRVPMILFDATSIDGSPLDLDTVLGDWRCCEEGVAADGTLATQDAAAAVEEQMMIISQMEHPILGRTCFCLHPCKTATAMSAALAYLHTHDDQQHHTGTDCARNKWPRLQQQEKQRQHYYSDMYLNAFLQMAGSTLRKWGGLRQAPFAIPIIGEQ